MGIVLLLLDIDCEIPLAHIPAALQAVKTLPTGDFVAQLDVDKAETLEEALHAWRWGGGPGDDGRWPLYDFFGEKSGSEAELFAALGPYVKRGSFILVAADNGNVWRWYFDGERMIHQPARLTFA